MDEIPSVIPKAILEVISRLENDGDNRYTLPDGVYNGLKYVSWECFQCGIPNISTSIFDTTIFEVSNSFSQLSSNEHLSPESDISFSFPNATSSPSRPGAQQDTAKRKDLPLRVVTLNCQSIKTGGKPAQLQNMISSLQGDIVIGSESWLNSSIKSQEVFPEGFNSYRRDRPKRCVRTCQTPLSTASQHAAT